MDLKLQHKVQTKGSKPKSIKWKLETFLTKGNHKNKTDKTYFIGIFRCLYSNIIRFIFAHNTVRVVRNCACKNIEQLGTFRWI